MDGIKREVQEELGLDSELLLFIKGANNNEAQSKE